MAPFWYTARAAVTDGTEWGYAGPKAMPRECVQFWRVVDRGRVDRHNIVSPKEWIDFICEQAEKDKRRALKGWCQKLLKYRTM